ncbi:MAG: hypothetical protein QM811_03430 [Pirellulales bacterium]
MSRNDTASLLSDFDFAFRRFFPVLLCVCFCTTLSADEVPDGIYVRRLAGDGVKLTRVDIDGGEAILGVRLSDKLGTATWKAIKNDHSEFTLTLTGHDHLPKATDETAQLAVVIDGVCAAVTRGQKSDGVFDGSLSAWIHGENTAIKLAKKLNVDLPRRKHPGHRYVLSWKPDRDAYRPGEAVTLLMTLENVGQHPISFRVGGQNRGPRDNQFRFLAYKSWGQGKAVPDNGDPTNFGGIGSYHTCKPGEKYTAKVGLDRWFRFEESDHFLVTGIFELELHEKQPDGSFGDAIWKELATGECTVIVDQENARDAALDHVGTSP